MTRLCSDGTQLAYVSFTGMIDEADKLGVRAMAAIAAAKELTESLRDRRHVAEKLVRRFYFRASFHPKTLKVFSPLDFPEPRRPNQPFPFEADEV